MKPKKNIRERQVQEAGLNDGWEVLSKGWPDFLLYKEETNEALFIEVKRTCKSEKHGLSKHQRRMHEILKKLGLDVVVQYIG